MDVPGEHDDIQGDEHIDDVVLVDQSPIGKTTRSNPASYVGAFDAIRKALRRPAAGPGARLYHGQLQLQCRQRALPRLRRQRLRARGDAVPQRRLPALPGLRRPPLPRRGAGGDRRPGGAEDRPARSIAEVLEMTVTEALGFFAD
ncbi:MAG: hypothetical protein U5L11_05610 [Arhodomonas sp.]|nr:hypothetical protein [Arhodomonas sp.]